MKKRLSKNSEEGIYPENIKSGSDVKTWWKCENGHSWQTRTKHIAIPQQMMKKGLPQFYNLVFQN